MLINELSKKTGVSVHTLRYYENLGLIQGTPDESIRTNNYKIYNEQVIERLEIIKEAKEIGYTLAEIKVILNGWFDGTLKADALIGLLSKKINEIDLKMSQLKQAKKRLKDMIGEIENGRCC